MATKWLESIDFMKAEISLAQFVIVVVVQVPVEVLINCVRRITNSHSNLTYPVLPRHRGSLASSQAMIVGSFL